MAVMGCESSVTGIVKVPTLLNTQPWSDAETFQSQNDPNWSIQRKYNEGVTWTTQTSVRGLRARAAKHASLSVTNLRSPLLKK